MESSISAHDRITQMNNIRIMSDKYTALNILLFTCDFGYGELYLPDHTQDSFLANQ